MLVGEDKVRQSSFWQKFSVTSANPILTEEMRSGSHWRCSFFLFLGTGREKKGSKKKGENKKIFSLFRSQYEIILSKRIKIALSTFC